jgi:hypothetical protein
VPLYISDKYLDSYDCQLVAAALRAIRQHVAELPVTPSVALSMIKQYLQPLIPPEHHHLLYEKRVATWNSVWGLHSSLAFAIGKTRSQQQEEVITAVEAVYSRSASPPREFVFPTIIEVTSFLNICRLLRIPVDARLSTSKTINLFHFCDLCWRHPLPGRKLCAHHAPNNALQYEDGTQAAAARYKAGYRQREQFDKTVNRILTKEMLEFHKGSFTPVVLLPEHGIAVWLSERRPAVWQLLGEHQQAINDGNAVSILLDVLHSPDGLPATARRICEQINQHLRLHPLLVWPLLVRAEGWHQSRNALRGKWGGSRAEAGRPAKIECRLFNTEGTTVIIDHQHPAPSGQ